MKKTFLALLLVALVAFAFAEVNDSKPPSDTKSRPSEPPKSNNEGPYHTATEPPHQGAGGDDNSGKGSYDGGGGASGRGKDNSGEGYKQFLNGNKLGSFEVLANGNVQEFNFEEANHQFTASVLLAGTADSNLTITALSQLGDFADRLKGKFSKFTDATFSTAYDFSFSGDVQVNSFNFTLQVSNQAAVLGGAFLNRLGFYFVSASNQFFGDVEHQVTKDDANTYVQFNLLPTKRGVYFFALFNSTEPLPVLYDTKRRHDANKLVRLAFDAGLELEFKNKNNCTSEVSFRDEDNHSFPRNHTSLGRFFDVEVTDQNGLDATLTFTFNATALAERGINLNRLRWAVLHENGTWLVQGGTVTGSVLVHTTTHFSSWGVFAAPADSGNPSPPANTLSQAKSSDAPNVFSPIAFVAITFVLAMLF